MYNYLAHSNLHRLPILNQPEYIRRALSAGKHVLSEKPVAENVKDAEDLIKWYNSSIDNKRVTWSVAENQRYLNSFDYAQSQVQKLGRVLGFRTRVHTMVQPGSKYYGAFSCEPHVSIVSDKSIQKPNGEKVPPTRVASY